MRQSRFLLPLLIGVITGLADIVLVKFSAPELVRTAYVPPAAWVTIPVVWTTVCLLVTIVFSLSSIRRLRESAVIFAGPGLLLLSRGGPALKHAAHISVIAATLICISVAIAVAGVAGFILTAHGALITRMIRPSFALVAAGLVVVGTTAEALSWIGADQTAARRSDGPSIILIFLDTVRYDDARQMVNLSRLASRSVVFENAWAPAPWTLPSHFAVFTGADPWRVSFDTERLRFNQNMPTLAATLASRGYSTAAIFANSMLAPGTGLSRGFQRLENSPPNVACRSGLAYLLIQGQRHAGRQRLLCRELRASEVVERAKYFIRRTHQPYFLALNLNDAHEPFLVERSCRERNFSGYTDLDWKMFNKAYQGGSLSPAAASRIHDQYRAAMRCMDRSLGSLFDYALRQGRPNGLVIAVVGDHGEQFGEHGVVGHANSLYEQVLHVPLLLMVPNEKPRRVADPVTITDLYPTLLHAAHVTPDGGLLDGRRRPVVATFNDRRGDAFPGPAVASIVSSKYHLLRWDNGREEVYDYKADGSESAPVDVRNNPGAVFSLTAALLKSMAGNTDQTVHFRALGYLR